MRFRIGQLLSLCLCLLIGSPTNAQSTPNKPTTPVTQAPAAQPSPGANVSETSPPQVTKPSEPPTTLPTPVGRVVWIKGTFTAETPNQETRNLKKKSIIYLKETLITDAKSQAEIVFTDNTLKTFKENTSYTIDKYTDKKKEGSFVSSITAGGFRTITGTIAKNNPNNYQVNTPVATIGVRGTDYQMALKDGELFLVVYKGKACMTNKPSDPAIKGTEMCFDKNKPYGKVSDRNKAPEQLKDRPPELGSQLEIVSTQQIIFKPVYQRSGPMPSQSTPGGVISNFCIE